MRGARFVRGALFLVCLAKAGVGVADVSESLKGLETNSEFVDVGTLPGVRLDLRYASENNFLKKNLYGPLNRCFLHQKAAALLGRAIALLEKGHPEWKFLIFDCLRPRSAQKILWEAVADSERRKYVADPAKGSIHNFGLAIDLSLCDASGRELDMGTEYDQFNDLSEPVMEEKNLKKGRLSQKQLENRRLLRALMIDAGFTQNVSEWWHFDALPANQIRKSFKIIE